jgi:putative hydrolase of the HAD superfamily
MSRIPPGVRAVFFDAVGTLLHPHPPAAEVYAAVGRWHGSALPGGEITRRFAAAFRAEEEYDARDQHRTSEERERQRWRRIVAAVLEVNDPERCFAELYEHFARPASWRCESGTEQILARLRQSGFVVGLASNFDHRLRGLVAGLPELAAVRHVAISSEVGWKKPAPAFFAALTALTGLRAEQILLVGDDFDNDFRGARQAGMHALLFDPRRRHPPADVEHITALSELLDV